MRKSVAWITPAVVSIAALTALALDHSSVISTVHAQVANESAEALCPRGNATLRGHYLSMGGGSVGGVPVAFVGRIDLDGKGHVNNPFTLSAGGSVSEAVQQGTYTVNSDCGGTQTLAGTSHFNFIVTPDGSKFDYISTDAGTVISGSASLECRTRIRTDQPRGRRSAQEN